MNAAMSRRAILVFASVAWIASAGLAQAATLKFHVPLTGAAQVPPVQTAGSGTAALTYNTSTRVLHWTVTYSHLSGPATMAHFHGPATADKNGPVKVWISKKGATTKSPIKGHATLSQADAQEFMAGEWYVNVHTKDHPAGEIRGQVTPPKG